MTIHLKKEEGCYIFICCSYTALMAFCQFIYIYTVTFDYRIIAQRLPTNLNK
jgi:hypothetical protein